LFYPGASAPTELCSKEKFIRHRHAATGASPALRAGDRAIRGSAKATCGCHAPASSPFGLRWPLRAPPIPCAAPRQHPCYLGALRFCFAKTSEFVPAGMYAAASMPAGCISKNTETHSVGLKLRCGRSSRSSDILCRIYYEPPPARNDARCGTVPVKRNFRLPVYVFPPPLLWRGRL
jgi:hypothetical protein